MEWALLIGISKLEAVIQVMGKLIISLAVHLKGRMIVEDPRTRGKKQVMKICPSVHVSAAFVAVRCIHIRVALTVAQEQSSQGGLLLAVVVVSAGTRLTGVLGTLQKTLVPKICSCR